MTSCTHAVKMFPLSHTIHLSDLYSGMHAYVWRYGYQHHGIVINVKDLDDDDTRRFFEHDFVVLEQNHQGLRKVTLEEFQKGSKLKRAAYGVSKFEKKMKYAGCCYEEQCFDALSIVERAKGEFKTRAQFWVYDVASKNCEQFVLFCTLGKHKSEQVLSVSFYLSSIPTILKTVADEVIALASTVVNGAYDTAIFVSTVQSWKMISVLATLGICAIDVGILVVKLSVYYYLTHVKPDPELLQIKINHGFAVTPFQFLRDVSVTCGSSAISIGFSFVGGFVGTFLPLPGSAFVLSLVCGTIGYLCSKFALRKLISYYITDNETQTAEISQIKKIQ